MSWYLARLLFESNVSDQQSEETLCEESMRLVYATDEENAHEKALELGKVSQHNYKNSNGDMVNWRFVDVLEVYDMCENELRTCFKIALTTKNRYSSSG